jgi:hypothetical protein
VARQPEPDPGRGRLRGHRAPRDVCDWCEYPPEKLLEWCGDVDLNPPFDVAIFKRFPAGVQRDLVIKALHEHSA